MLVQPGQLSAGHLRVASGRVGPSPLPPTLFASLFPFSPFPFSNKSRLRCSWCCLDSTIGARSAWEWTQTGKEERASKRCAFPAAPGGRLRASERLSYGCLKGVMSAPSDFGSGHKEVKSGRKKQLAEAENRFNIVTLTMYLIDISLFVM